MTSSSPLIIVGAPRSGTNMLRDALVRLGAFATWPCDEINPIWRHGNLDYPNDELPADLARSEVRRYINSRFRQVGRQDGSIVVEKTCANSLRVPFVDRVVPDARFLFIHRNPFDVVASAMLRWDAPTDWGYLLRKTRFVPLRDLPRHAVGFLTNRWGPGRATGPRRWWGPRFAGMESIDSDRPIEEVCALQWRRCVELATQSLREMPADRWRSIAYESFVADPAFHLAALCDWYGLEANRALIEKASREVSTSSIGKGRERLGEDTCLRIARLIGDPEVARHDDG